MLLASVAAFSFLWVLRLLLRRLRHRVDAWVKVRLEQVRSESARQLLSGLITSGRSMARVLAWLFVALVFEEWLRFSFGRFPYTQPWAEAKMRSPAVAIQ